MRARPVVVFISIFATFDALAACGAAQSENPPAGTPPAGGTAATVTVAEDAGPTTTTTLTLSDAGDLRGTRLTSTSQSGQLLDVAVDGGLKAPRQPEVGRGVKDLQAIVLSRRDEARGCYDAVLKSHPRIEGNLDIQWTIDPKGVVTDISVDTSRSDILEPAVGNCVIAIIKKIHFNESAKGFETRTHYPFSFHPRSNGAMIVSGDAGK
jgi:hypothetical protein